MIATRITAAVLLAAAAASVGPATAEPVQDINPRNHGNLAAAQDLVRQAFDRLTAAQAANEYDLGGHAARAKALLEQANQEIKLAAQSANRR
jgi:hypothetical protein